MVLGLLFWLAEWLMPYRAEWNRPQGDLTNDIVSGTVTYILLPIFLKPLYLAALLGATVWIAQQAGGSLWPGD